MVTHFNATLDMGGWLDLTQQGLSPCKKYKTSWRSFDKSYRIIELVQLSLSSCRSDAIKIAVPLIITILM